MIETPAIAALTIGDAEAVLERAQRLMSAGNIAEVMQTFAPDVGSAPSLPIV